MIPFSKPVTALAAIANAILVSSGQEGQLYSWATKSTEALQTIYAGLIVSRQAILRGGMTTPPPGPPYFPLNENYNYSGLALPVPSLTNILNVVQVQLQQLVEILNAIPAGTVPRFPQSQFIVGAPPDGATYFRPEITATGVLPLASLQQTAQWALAQINAVLAEEN